MEEPNFNHFHQLRSKLYVIVFGTDTPAGKAFDVFLLIVILTSIVSVMLESVSELRSRYDEVFTLLEWSFTAFFTLEYLLRIFITR
ncbi:MAG TPA: ion transporter, partial [Cytophagales bacterium]|nr:ion transporter [Cytophagales bacterium]